MKVADLMTSEVRACSTHDSLNAAARIMWEHDCGCAPVVDTHGKLVGIVTDRDVCMAAYTQGRPLESIPIERAMSAKVISCKGADDLESAHSLMRTHEVHRLPVTDTRGRLAGILSLSDVVKYAVGNGAAPTDALEVLTTLSAIRRRRERTMHANGTAHSLNGESASGDGLKKPPRKRSPRSKKPVADIS